MKDNSTYKHQFITSQTFRRSKDPQYLISDNLWMFYTNIGKEMAHFPFNERVKIDSRETNCANDYVG